MKSLKQMILNEIDSGKHGSSDDIAKIAGYSRGIALRKVLNDEKKEFSDLDSLIKLVKYFFPDKSENLLVDYAASLDINKQSARHMLEYLTMNRLFKDLSEMLDRMEGTTNEESKEWCKVYRIDLRYHECTTEKEYLTLIKELNEMKIKSTVLDIFRKILIVYCYSQIKRFPLDNVTYDLEYIEDTVTNNFMQTMYRIRTLEILSINSLRVHNDPIKARMFANLVISSNAPTTFKAYANFIIGQSYLFSSCGDCVSHFEESKNLYELIGRQSDANVMEEKIEFANVFWDKKNGVCKYTRNEMFRRIKNREDCIRYVEENKSEVDESFLLYLEGIYFNSESKHMLSIIKYTKKNDYFSTGFSKIELLKKGACREMLNELTTIN
ncbi:AimR family lysis-lysogeny pheromone receptor [Cytobacillus kochii]|uniref:AimR family lysis-lysogeny pheromone receptor n=1 Tax=Cytobacillus kochii TaxID=859143 RepID=UPI001CD792F9|nr:AimR family lysis-lysogeny pheromone receptor [Cytobacillus kochii]MCA1026996.1 AimR family lysis-lysogeny pheromone receptor [Cytobacillus kochii]